MNIAIIDSGIAGLTCAWRLAGHHQVTLFEAEPTVGGHTATVDVATPQGIWAIDTGFIVYNDRTYPRFIGLEYNEHTLSSLFARRRNLVSPRFWGLLKEIARFNRLAKGTLGNVDRHATLATFLEQHRFSAFFARHYILPMGAAIWSSSLHVAVLPQLLRSGVQRPHH
ncbi:putative NAD/FAD-binding protein [Raoultella sp. BIGb0132]|nr:putative NAD/FAD-binding protein [Raoultella sp. BIGb0132]MCS4287042.1 putative NAD/FAD-binding protein [Raoultella terrigena]